MEEIKRKNIDIEKLIKEKDGIDVDEVLKEKGLEYFSKEYKSKENTDVSEIVEKIDNKISEIENALNDK